MTRETMVRECLRGVAKSIGDLTIAYPGRPQLERVNGRLRMVPADGPTIIRILPDGPRLTVR